MRQTRRRRRVTTRRRRCDSIDVGSYRLKYEGVLSDCGIFQRGGSEGWRVCERGYRKTSSGCHLPQMRRGLRLFSFFVWWLKGCLVGEGSKARSRLLQRVVYGSSLYLGGGAPLPLVKPRFFSPHPTLLHLTQPICLFSSMSVFHRKIRDGFHFDARPALRSHPKR